MRPLSIKYKLMFFASVPFLAIAYFTLNHAYNEYTILNNVNKTKKYITLSTKMSALVRELQIERGLSAGFVGSKGKAFKAKLSLQRERTNLELEQFKEYLQTFQKRSVMPSLKKDIKNYLYALKTLEHERKGVDNFTKSFSEVINYYSKRNAELLNILGTLTTLPSDEVLGRNLIAYHSFLLFQEQVGIERAVLSHVFAQDSFDEALFIRFIGLVSAEEAYLDIALKNASKSIQDFYYRTASNKVFQEVENLREHAKVKAHEGSFDISPALWFNKISTKITLLNSVENFFVRYLSEEINAIHDASYKALLRSVVLGGLIVLFIVLFLRSRSLELLRSFNNLLHKVRLTNKQKIATFEETLLTFIEIIEKRDAYTAGHTKRVAHYAVLIAKQLGYARYEVKRLEKAAFLHDIGKIQTPDNVLLKPERLNNTEYQVIQAHASVGYEMLKEIKMYKNIAEIMRHHHERYDGTGYPQGLKGDEIPPLSRILMLADAFDAMTTNRIYKPRKSIQEALEEIKMLKNVQFHPEVVDAALIALQDISVPDGIHQEPLTFLEKERFSYFYKDQLTHCYNKALLLKRLEANKEERKYLAKTTFYLKHFSRYNHDFGWDKGDELLKTLAKILQEAFKEDSVHRLEGDDFVLLHKEVPKKETLEKVVKEIEGSFIKACSVELNYKHEVFS